MDRIKEVLIITSITIMRTKCLEKYFIELYIPLKVNETGRVFRDRLKKESQ
jgi:hypothetical protein